MRDQIRLVRVANGPSLLIPVTIDGVDKFMIFDTGAPASSLTRAVAGQLHLSIHQILGAGYGDQLADGYGDLSLDGTEVRDLKFGREEVRDFAFRIWPDPNLEKVDPRLTGVFSIKELSRYDVDVDFLNGVLKLFSPEHCEGKILYWKADTVAVGGVELRNNHIHVSVTLDGQKFDAIIDSGAPNSSLSAEAARRFFGLTPASPGMEKWPSLTKYPQYPVYKHKFDALRFNGVAVSNPAVAIWPDIVNRNADRSMQSTESRTHFSRANVGVPQLIIGMDILRKLHVYFAFREHRMYVSDASSNSSPPK
jgi:predicted aspartyl protease